MKYIALFVFSALFAASVGCNKQIEDKRTAQLDSIIDVMEVAHRSLTALDSAKLHKLNEVYDAYADFFKNDFDDLSNPEVYSIALNDLGTCIKRVSNTVKSYGQWKEELENSIKQLKSLRHDYAHQLLEKEEFEEYFYAEAANSAHLNEEINENVGPCSYCTRTYPELSAKLDSIRRAYLAKKEND